MPDKPIHEVKEDINIILTEVNALRMNFKELAELNKEIKEKIELLLRPVSDLPKKSKGWIYGEY